MNVKLKQALRLKLRQERVLREIVEQDRVLKHNLLKKELRSLEADSARAIEIRKELGTATLKDILGDKYPIRVCRHCGKRAFTESDLWAFVYSKSSRYQRDNCCTDCNSLLAKVPGVKIIGEHCLLPTIKTCVRCGRKDDTKGHRSWFLSRATVCKECLGTHSNAFGFPLEIETPPTYTHNGKEYGSIQSLANALGLSYYHTRTLIITDKLKEHNG